MRKLDGLALVTVVAALGCGGKKAGPADAGAAGAAAPAKPGGAAQAPGSEPVPTASGEAPGALPA